MDTHVRAILANASPRLLALNTALGHDPSLFHGRNPEPPSLTEAAMAEEIADEFLYPYAGRPPLYEDAPPADPLRTQLSQLALKHTLIQDILDRRSPRTQPYVTTSTPHSDLDLRFAAIPRAMEGSQATLYEPPDTFKRWSDPAALNLPSLPFAPAHRGC
jgi:hypothetical protein